MNRKTQPGSMKWIRRIVFLLAVFSGICLCAAALAAQEGTCGANLTWKLDDGGKLTISGKGKMKNFSGLNTLEDWQNYRDEVKSIEIREGITSIGMFAFEDFANLKEVRIPLTVTQIYDGAFRNCKKLAGFELNRNISSIVGNAFEGCTSLKTWKLDPDNQYFILENDVLYTRGSTQKMLVSYPSGKKDSSFIVPEGVETIGSFAGNPYIREITVPDTVQSIGSHAFARCTKLKTIRLPVSVQKMGLGVFNGCSSLESVRLPNCPGYNADSAFYKCSKLKSVTLPDTITELGTSAFAYCSSLTEIQLPSTLKKIGDWAFTDCTSLKSITIPDSVTEMGDYVFQNCSSLKTVKMPQKMNKIGILTFTNCKSLQSMTFPSGLDAVEWQQFAGCKSLKSVTLPKGLLGISVDAFWQCDKLEKVVLPKELIVIGEGAFDKCPNLKQVYYAGSEGDRKKIEIYPSNEALEQAEWHYDDSSAEPESKDVIISGGKYRLDLKNRTAQFLGTENPAADVLKIPDTVKNSGKKYSVTGIAENACRGMKYLEKVTIGKNVKTIGAGAFAECKRLNVLTISSTKLKASSVGKDAFAGIGENAAIKVPGKKLKEYKKWLIKKGAPETSKITK